MTYTAIVKRLRDTRKQADIDLAARASREYGVQFGDNFTYVQGGKTVVMSHPTAIAKQYRKLHGMDVD